MADATTRPGSDDLQFDRAIDAGAESPGHPVCAKCQAPIRMYYYHVNGETACSTCKATMDRAGSGGGAKAGMPKAILFGLGAALAGAFIYYAVMKYLELEIGYVAILIGFMVGYAVRHAVANRGSRRFQLLAAGLTYLAVAVAYAPFAMGESDDDGEPEVAAVEGSLRPIVDELPAADTKVAAADDAGANDASAADADAAGSPLADSTIVEPQALGAAGFAIGLAGILVFVLALPVIVILGSMPSGLISALIIAIGMRQAWTMTGGEALSIAGPFKVGSEPPPAPAQA